MIVKRSRKSPQATLENIAQRVRKLRLERGWSQLELAARANIRVATYQVFERTGSIALERLYRIAIALQRTSELENLFQPLPIKSLEELAPKPERKRGRSITL